VIVQRVLDECRNFLKLLAKILEKTKRSKAEYNSVDLSARFAS